MTYFSEIFNEFLVTLNSETLANLSDADLTETLNSIIKISIGEFKFPKISLSFTIADPDTEDNGYYFEEALTRAEINVLLIIMKKVWLAQQLDDDGKFKQKYVDASIRTFSQAAKLKEIRNRYELAKKEVTQAQYNYSRVSTSNTPTIGDIYSE